MVNDYQILIRQVEYCGLQSVSVVGVLPVFVSWQNISHSKFKNANKMAST